MNMSYCRMQNTANDLFDCNCAIADEEGLMELSESEREWAERLYERCKDFIDYYEAGEEYERENKEEDTNEEDE